MRGEEGVFQIELISNVASATREACQVIGNVLNV